MCTGYLFAQSPGSLGTAVWTHCHEAIGIPCLVNYWFEDVIFATVLFFPAIFIILMNRLNYVRTVLRLPQN